MPKIKILKSYLLRTDCFTNQVVKNNYLVITTSIVTKLVWQFGNL